MKNKKEIIEIGQYRIHKEVYDLIMKRKKPPIRYKTLKEEEKDQRYN